MSVSIDRATVGDVQRIIATRDDIVNPEAVEYCLKFTHEFWVGSAKGSPCCAWGLIPPTLLSDHAYLWMMTLPEASKHEFLLVRYSQICVEDMLTRYPIIKGHCVVDAHRSIRWVRWLGGVFHEPENGFVPFTIRARRKRGLNG